MNADLPGADPGAESVVSAGALPGKVVLVVIDAMAPEMLERAIREGEAPALARVLGAGHFVRRCVSPFPSVTPVCAATITTGGGPAEHGIPAMNWYHREEGRYVEYGSSFTASRRHGVVRSLTDTVYRMNGEHLSSEIETVFETLDDQGVRTAGTTYLIYRGRFSHDASDESTLARLATSAVFGGRAVMGPRELFYADLYASRRTGCRSQLGMPGIRDQHTGCVGAYLAEHDLYDFMLFSLPDNDAWSHRNGPEAQLTSIANADRQLMRLMEAGGGPEAFLAANAVIVCSDHSQVAIEATIPVIEAFADLGVAAPRRLRESPTEGRVAVCPSMRSAQVYVLDPEDRERLLPQVVDTLAGLPGVDLTMWLDGAAAVIRDGFGAELRFVPGDGVVDERNGRWDVEGDPGVLSGEIRDGRLLSPDYPDALARVWSALHCANGGDVLASAGPGYEFLDWGGQHHIGGGSHGSLCRDDSLASLLVSGFGDAVDARAQADGLWALRDLKALVCDHLGGGSSPDGGLARC